GCFAISQIRFSCFTISVQKLYLCFSEIEIRFYNMQKEIELAVSPEKISDESYLLERAAEKLKTPVKRIKGIKIHKRSIDGRSRNVVYRVRLIVYIDEEPDAEVFSFPTDNISSGNPVIIIGAGPAGLFAALRCNENGFQPIIVQRERHVKARLRDLATHHHLED